jgi:hypothetical protein
MQIQPKAREGFELKKGPWAWHNAYYAVERFEPGMSLEDLDEPWDFSW